MAKKQASITKLRMAVVGVGGMGQGHCETLKKRVPETKLVAVCDIDPAVAEMVGARHKVPFFTSHKDLIKAKLCDAVMVATPHPVHPVVGIDCMKAGLHVLTEKPMAEKVSAAEKMVQAAKKYKVALGVMFQRRFEPNFAKALELVRSGALGKVHRATMISPEYRSQAYYDSGTWRATWVGEGGGVMMNQAPHIMDLFVQLAGMPVSVRGTVDTRLHHIEVEDFAQATMTFKDGGAGYFYCSTNEPSPGQMIEVYGDKGKLCFRNGELHFWTCTPPVTEFTKTWTGSMWGGPKVEEVQLKIKPKQTGHYTVHRNFARHIRRGEELIATGESGLASLELANAITLSSFTNEEIKLPLKRRQYDQLLEKLRKESTFKKKGVKVQRITDTRF